MKQDYGLTWGALRKAWKAYRIAKIQGDSPRDRKFLIASDLAKRCRTVTTDSNIAGLPVDDQLLEYTISIKGVLATNDGRLRERARQRGLPVLLMRGKKQLALEGSNV
jgi:rRNA-processing protein FCF1